MSFHPFSKRFGRQIALSSALPIYYSEPTGLVRSFLERITFPAMSYSTYQSVFNGKIDVDVFLTMNAPMQFYKQNYERRFQEYFAPFRFLNGQIRLIPVCDTVQVKDYSKYDMASFSEEHKKAVHEAQFPAALEFAFKIGTEKQL